MSITKVGVLVAGTLVAGGLYAGWRLWRWKPMPASTSGPAPSPLNAALLAAAEALVPPGSPMLHPGDAALDPVYGGRLPDVEGAPAWGYYQERLAGGKSGGTTCGVALAYWMGRAGWPAELVNRRPDDAAGSPGVGFVPGLHVSRIVGGAQKRGWYVMPDKGGPRAADAYHVDHPPVPNSDHVGVVESVSEPAADGTRTVTTIDGGQGKPGADVGRQVRTLSADGRTLTLNGVPARVLGWVRAPMDVKASERGVA